MAEPSHGMCIGKKRYSSFIAVMAAIGTVSVIFNRKSARSYPCPLCNGFHITTKPLREDRVRQEEEARKLFVKIV